MSYRKLYEDVCTSRSFFKKIYLLHILALNAAKKNYREREIKQTTKVSLKNSNHMFYKMTMKAFMKYERVLFSLCNMKGDQKYIEIRYVSTFYLLDGETLNNIYNIYL